MDTKSRPREKAMILLITIVIGVGAAYSAWGSYANDTFGIAVGSAMMGIGVGYIFGKID